MMDFLNDIRNFFAICGHFCFYKENQWSMVWVYLEKQMAYRNDREKKNIFNEIHFISAEGI